MLRALYTIAILFVIGAVIAFLIYWLANSVFNAGIGKSAMIVNIVADGIIFCVASLIFQRVNNKRSEK